MSTLAKLFGLTPVSRNSLPASTYVPAPRDATWFDQLGIPNPIKGYAERSSCFMQAWLASRKTAPFSKDLLRDLQSARWTVLEERLLSHLSYRDQEWYRNNIGITVRRVSANDPLYSKYATVAGWIVLDKDRKPTNAYWAHIHGFNPETMTH